MFLSGNRTPLIRKVQKDGKFSIDLDEHTPGCYCHMKILTYSALKNTYCSMIYVWSNCEICYLMHGMCYYYMESNHFVSNIMSFFKLLMSFLNGVSIISLKFRPYVDEIRSKWNSHFGKVLGTPLRPINSIISIYLVYIYMCSW